MKKIAWEEDFIHEINLYYMYWIKQTQQIQPSMIFFFISKSAMWKKIRSVSKEDTNQFLIKKKFRSVSNEDVDLFLFWEKIKSTFKEDANPFLF